MFWALSALTSASLSEPTLSLLGPGFLAVSLEHCSPSLLVFDVAYPGSPAHCGCWGCHPQAVLQPEHHFELPGLPLLWHCVRRSVGATQLWLHFREI